MDKVIGLLASTAHQGFNDSDRRQENASATHLVNQDRSHAGWLGHMMCNWHRETGHVMKCRPIEGSVAITLHQVGQMGSTGFVTTSVMGPEPRGQVELPRNK
ncbi:hypothetical protein GLUCOINTEAF2_0203809 [Komagataeibacter intermedius AF2]|uniref:Uncharacterized protein n=1 Tax=Komagataeibacter intermedius AF2 TaxID=1458464 RepID=A0A0C1UWA6_9PROT|nr:hypothetical protein GLUCOINTEAF2_0203490 [Komagataeibacter intermedius AF2]KPH88496.1 hypothetical protein GLUCOINTEAF2_0203809 [Komagataeibacter intermedius AF2]